MTQNTKGLSLLIIAILLLSISCKIDPITSVENPIINIEEDFYINFSEQLRASKDDRIFTFQLESLDTFDCTNYKISHTISIGSGITTISINDINEPADCIIGNAPAYEEASLAHLKQGVHTFNILLKDPIDNKGLITITDDLIRVEMETNNGLAFKNVEMRRVPENMIWGYFSYEDESKEAIDEMLPEFAQLVEDRIYQEGYYGQFSIDEDNGLVLEIDPRHPNVVKFVKYFEDVDDRLINFLQLQVNNIEDLEVKVFTSGGKVYQ